MYSDGKQESEKKQLRVLVVDDHPVVLAGVKAMLGDNGHYVMGATTSHEALLLLSHAGPVDVAIIDLALTTPSDGLDLVKDMRGAGFTGAVIIFTMHDELWNARILKEANVDGIVLKGDHPSELIAAVKAVAKGEHYASLTFHTMMREIRTSCEGLSDKDIEVLKLVAKGYGNTEIADIIYSSVKTVEYHRSRVMRKLGAASMPEAVAKAISMGVIHT